MRRNLAALTDRFVAQNRAEEQHIAAQQRVTELRHAIEALGDEETQVRKSSRIERQEAQRLYGARLLVSKDKDGRRIYTLDGKRTSKAKVEELVAARYEALERLEEQLRDELELISKERDRLQRQLRRAYGDLRQASIAHKRSKGWS